MVSRRPGITDIPYTSTALTQDRKANGGIIPSVTVTEAEIATDTEAETAAEIAPTETAIIATAKRLTAEVRNFRFPIFWHHLGPILRRPSILFKHTFLFLQG